MKAFMDENFMLSTESARKLYFDSAKDMPIFDYHCHLPVKDIAEDTRFDDIGYLWLGGDHYKWRAMDAFGIDDECVRGSASYYEKFLAYAKMMPNAIGNPLYHWTHLELQRVFGIDTPLNEKTAPGIYAEANARMRVERFSAKELIRRFDVRAVCTTDDPADDLKWHRMIAQDPNFATKVLPSFRPDNAISPEKEGFAQYIERLSAASNMEIRSPEDLLAALENRLDFFHEVGARISDHGMNTLVFAPYNRHDVQRAFDDGLCGKVPDPAQLASFKGTMLTQLGRMYRARNWTQQYHMNALRNNNTRMFKLHGPDTGYDSVGGDRYDVALSRLLDAQNRDNNLPKTILYSLNGNDNALLAAMAGNFQGEVPGKIQLGSGWWFNDQQYGMRDQMRTLASMGLLGTFVGMLTDSRSFLSYPRHEYFRRILCDVIGQWVENGEYPADWAMLDTIVKGICFNNAKNYFGIL